MANESIKAFVEPSEIAALAVFLASKHGKSISGQMLSLDNDMQKASWGLRRACGELGPATASIAVQPTQARRVRCDDGCPAPRMPGLDRS